MSFEEYLRSVVSTANLTFAIIVLGMAILIHSQMQLSKNRNKGKTK